MQAPETCWWLRRIMAREVPLSDTDATRQLELTARYDALAERHKGDADIPDEIEAQLAAIEQELDAIGAKERVYRPEDIARAGATISLSSDGTLRVDRDYLRPEDKRGLKRLWTARSHRPAAAALSTTEVRRMGISRLTAPEMGPGSSKVGACRPCHRVTLGVLHENDKAVGTAAIVPAVCAVVRCGAPTAVSVSSGVGLD